MNLRIGYPRPGVPADVQAVVRSGAEKQVFIPGKLTTTHMSETTGHFERGRWIPDPVGTPEPAPEEEAAPAAPTVDERMHEASQSVRKAVSDVVSAGHHLFGTPEGHERIEQAARTAGEDLERAINAWTEAARQALRKG